ncbi:MAG: tetratricopeptide repeat protein [Anaerolineae bacterium]|nr:tetratricopeptide repeat protein [Anaerolineae bacterium]
MSDATNAVYLTYRRDVGAIPARAVYRALRTAELDVFMDLDSVLDERTRALISAQIAARPYCLLIATHGSLERCVESNDWLRYQLEQAQHAQAQIVVLHPPEFSFAQAVKTLGNLLTGALDFPITYESIPADVTRLRLMHLKPRPTRSAPESDSELLAEWQARLAALPPVTADQIAAQKLFERAFTRAQGDWQSRINDYTAALERYPEFAAAYARRGANREILDDLHGAMADFDAAIRLNPFNDVAYVNRGILFAKLGDLHSALLDFNEALRLNPTLMLAYYHRALACASRGDYDGALADLNIAIQSEPRAMFYFQRGLAYSAKGDDANALADYTEAVRLNPKLAEAYYNRGLIRAKSDMRRAVADWTAAIEADPKLAEAYYNRGLARAHWGDVEGTLEDMIKFLELVPEHEKTAEVRELIENLRQMRSGNLPDPQAGS